MRVKMQPFLGRRFLTARYAGLVNFTITTHGRLEMAVTNAGIGGEINAVADMSIEGGQKVTAVNLNSAFYDIKYQLRAMLKNGGGSIVNVSSILGLVGLAGVAG